MMKSPQLFQFCLKKSKETVFCLVYFDFVVFFLDIFELFVEERTVEGIVGECIVVGNADIDGKQYVVGELGKIVECIADYIGKTVGHIVGDTVGMGIVGNVETVVAGFVVLELELKLVKFAEFVEFVEFVEVVE